MYTVRITLSPDRLQFDLPRIAATSDAAAEQIARGKLIPWCGLDGARRCHAAIVSSHPITDC